MKHISNLADKNDTSNQLDALKSNDHIFLNVTILAWEESASGPEASFNYIKYFLLKEKKN